MLKISKQAMAFPSFLFFLLLFLLLLLLLLLIRTTFVHRCCVRNPLSPKWYIPLVVRH